MRILRVLVLFALVLFAFFWRCPEALLFGPAFDALERDDLAELDRTLARGLDVNTRNADMTLLMFAASRGHADAVRLLLERGARVDPVSVSGATALDFASLTGNAETLALLLRAGADPNAQDALRNTPLMYAVASGDPAKVVALLDAGADVARRNTRGTDALRIAIDYDRPDIVPLLTDALDLRATAARPPVP